MPEQPLTPAEKRRQDEIAEMNKVNKLDFAYSWSVAHGWPRFRKIDEQDENKDDLDPNQVALQIVSPLKNLRTEGVYAFDQGPNQKPDKFNMRITREGTAYPIPYDPGNFEQQYSRLMDLVASGLGVSTINIGGKVSNEKQLETLMKLAEEKGLAVNKFQGEIAQFIDTLSPEKQKKFHDWRQKLMINAEFADTSKNRIFDVLSKRIAAEETLTKKYNTLNDDAARKTKLKEDVLGVPPNQLQNDQKQAAIAKQLDAIEKRLKQLEEAKEELARHLNASKDAVELAAKGDSRADKLDFAHLENLHKKAEPNRVALVNAMETQQKDLALRLDTWKAEGENNQTRDLDARLTSLRTAVDEQKRLDQKLVQDISQQKDHQINMRPR